MSHQSNTQLYERAEQMLDYWTGTQHARTIEADIDRNDLEALAYHVDLAEKEMHLQEDNFFGSTLEAGDAF